MPNFFSRRKGRVEESYDLSEVLQLFRSESIESDATAPNNPGPGRIIGQLFDATGHRIERFINEAASQYFLGPQAVVEDIRRHCQARLDKERSLQETTGIMVHLSPTEQEYVILEKLGRRLLKLCRSPVLETQLEAAEAITTLAVEDPYVRRVLAGILHHKYLIPKYKEHELYIGNFKALISVKENEVYDFFQYLKKDHRILSRGDHEPQVDYLMDRLELFLRNPGVSFLMQRLIKGIRTSRRDLLRIYMHVASTNPLVVEWETLSVSIDALKAHIHWFHMDDFMRLARHFPILRVYQSDHSDPGKDGPLDLKEFADSSPYYAIRFLNVLCGSTDLATQLQFLYNLDEDTRRLFQGTVFNELPLALAHACNNIWLDHMQFTCLGTAAAVLYKYYSCGHPDEQALAKEAITASIKSSRYFKLALVVAACNNNVNVVDMSLLLKEIPSVWVSMSFWIGSLARRDFKRNVNIEPAGEDMGMCEDDMLFGGAMKTGAGARSAPDFTCWLEVRGDEYPFNVTGHFPILAGFDTSGKELYLARPSLGSAPELLLSYVSDGAQSLSISDCDGEVRVFDRFFVMVLKHDPCDFAVTNIPADAKFQTGPVSWLRDEGGYGRRRKEKFSWKSERWPSILARYAAKKLGGSKLPKSDGEDRFEDVSESDSQEITNLGSNEETGEGLEAVGWDTDSDEQGVLTIGEGSADPDKFGGHSQLIGEQYQLDLDSEQSSKENTEQKPTKVTLEALFKVPATDEGIERRQGADASLDVVDDRCEAGVAADEVYPSGDIQQIHLDDEHYFLEEQRQIEEERQLLADRMRKLDEREWELNNKIRALKLQPEDSRPSF